MFTLFSAAVMILPPGYDLSALIASIIDSSFRAFAFLSVLFAVV